MTKDEKTIFIAIAAYNENFLIQTIDSAFDMAENPDLLRIGVFSLNSDNVLPKYDHPNVRMLTAQFPSLLGVCPSRIAALFLYKDEDYYLQVDGHMLFEQNWDTKVKEKYELIKKDFDKPIITTYVPWWCNRPDGSIFGYKPISDIPAMPIEFSKSIFDYDVPMQDGYNVDWTNKEYHEHYGFSAHFVFTEPHFIKEIVPDIDMMFFGEEHTTALRAWTRGYRMFAIKNPIVWHYNKLNHFGKDVLYKNDRHMTMGDHNASQIFHVKNAEAIKKVRKILTGEILGYWGSPTKELLDEYQKKSNFDFTNFFLKKDFLDKEKEIK